MTFRIDQSDAIAYMRQLPADSVDLVFGSPPYEKCRLYLENGEDMGIARNTNEWVAWMVEVYREASRVCKGLVAFVVEGQTKNYKYSCAPLLLAADLHRAGFNLRKPPIFHRVGIPGSGGPDWLRNDAETVICVTPPGRLPYSDNTACGHAPKWAPGGAMSNRNVEGQRKNDSNGPKFHARQNGAKKITRRASSGHGKDQDTRQDDVYLPPVLANPGNVIQQTYTADEVAALLAEQADVITCVVGGGVMGHPLAHQNEAPFPETLSDFFVKSFCPPGGTVLDCFAGSGTTLASAVKHCRNGIGCDIRASQVELARRRVPETQPVFDFEQAADGGLHA